MSRYEQECEKDKFSHKNGYNYMKTRLMAMQHITSGPASIGESNTSWMGKIRKELKKLWRKQWKVEIEAMSLKTKMNVKKQLKYNESGIIRKRTTRQRFFTQNY